VTWKKIAHEDYFRVFTSVDGAISHKTIALTLSIDMDNLGRLCRDQKSIKKSTKVLYGKGERKIGRTFREKYLSAYGFCSLMLHDTKTNTKWFVEGREKCVFLWGGHYKNYLFQISFDAKKSCVDI
jgi:hypothetical protein